MLVMKAYWITIPLGLAFAVGGLALVNSAPRTAELGDAQRAIPSRYPVTDEMRKAAASLKLTKAPELVATDYLGNNYENNVLKQGYPTLIFFIKSGCPCSMDAQPIFNNMAKAFGPNARFLGVFDDNAVEAKAFANLNQVTFPILLDQKHDWIEAYKMTASASMALVDGKGQIVQVWPGYSQSIIRQANFLLGTLAGCGPQEFDYSMAPKELTAGCEFIL